MINVGVVTDISWDNYILIYNKFKKINPENYRLHVIHGKTLDLINRCSNRTLLTVLRHYSDNLSKTVFNMLKVCDIWIIFTNYIQYNTSTRLVIDKCKEYCIKYLIISEYNRDNVYSSFNYNHDISFKKNLDFITKKEDVQINEFNYIIYNDIYLSKQHVNITLSNSVKEKIRESYNNINSKKHDKSIKLLYDKDEIKREKQMKKANKAINQLEFSQNRLKYYKK